MKKMQRATQNVSQGSEYRYHAQGRLFMALIVYSAVGPAMGVAGVLVGAGDWPLRGLINTESLWRSREHIRTVRPWAVPVPPRPTLRERRFNNTGPCAGWRNDYAPGSGRPNALLIPSPGGPDPGLAKLTL